MIDALSKYMPDAYKRVARMVGYTLLLGADADNWHGLTVVLTARLTSQERAAMAWAVLRSLTPLNPARFAAFSFVISLMQPPQLVRLPK